MSEKDNKDFTVEQQKFLIEEFRELHKKIEEIVKREEDDLRKIMDSLQQINTTLTRLETRINTLLAYFPKLTENSKSENMWTVLIQVINMFLLVFTLIKTLHL